jgi:NAD-dependent deacetylase
MTARLKSVLAEAVGAIGRGRLVVLTGAGISAASGLPVFRGQPDAIWEEDVMEMATHFAFRRDPVGWWEWFIRRFSGVRDARPNDAHRAIAELGRWQRERGGSCTLITQNFDMLHEEGGAEDVIKVHGTISRLRCSREGCGNGAPSGSVPFDVFSPLEWVKAPRRETLPCCSSCGALLRAHVLLFDEYYSGHDDYGFAEALEAFGCMDLLLLVGTSMAVGITSLALEAAEERGAPVFRIDRVDDGLRGAALVRGPAEELLPALVSELERDS